MKQDENFLQAPEEMIGIGEAFFRRIAAVVVRFPRIVRGDARHFVEFRHVGGRIAVDRARRRGEDVDLVLEDEFVGEFRRPALVGLAVLGDKFDLVGFTADLKSRLQRLADTVERPVLRLGETGHWSGLRADVADLDDEIVRAQHRRRKDCGRSKCCRARLQHAPARRAGSNQLGAASSYRYLFFHVCLPPLAADCEVCHFRLISDRVSTRSRADNGLGCHGIAL